MSNNDDKKISINPLRSYQNKDPAMVVHKYPYTHPFTQSTCLQYDTFKILGHLQIQSKGFGVVNYINRMAYMVPIHN